MDHVIIHCSRIPQINWLTTAAHAQDAERNPDSVHLYRIRIADHQPAIPGYYNLLSADEVYRAGAYHHRKDSDRFVISRAILRILLAAGTDLPATDIRFGKTPHKKPYQVSIHEIAPCFNVSHAGDMIMIGMSGQDIGADIEFIDPTFGFDEVLDYAFTVLEKQYVRAAPDPRTSFYEIWSRKESLLKATGKGVGNNLASAQCLDGENQVPAASIGSATNWIVRSFDADQGYIGNISFANPAPISFYEVVPGLFMK
ncbi:MAG: 4'-phosphopantetheinyl transferase superfamily protein [Chitinophagaceae bacterium]|nr:MAG: 4'-phosphopantetheinyl transferase superfamily protein [Chitinophagaceae bacterium]